MMSQVNASSNEQSSRDLPSKLLVLINRNDSILLMESIPKHSLSILNSSINNPKLGCRNKTSIHTIHLEIIFGGG
jgi:hypothetical protein